LTLTVLSPNFALLQSMAEVGSERLATIKSADMSLDMQQDAVDCANAALVRLISRLLCSCPLTLAL